MVKQPVVKVRLATLARINQDITIITPANARLDDDAMTSLIAGHLLVLTVPITLARRNQL